MRDVFRQQMSHRCSRANFARKETSFCDPLLNAPSSRTEGG